MVEIFRMTRSIDTLRSFGSRKRVSTFAQDGKISPVAENAPPFATGYFCNNAQPFQVSERCIDRRGREARFLNELIGCQKRILLKQIMDP